MLLLYLQYFGDTDADGKVTSSELCHCLAPFVPGPPQEQIDKMMQRYVNGGSDGSNSTLLFELLAAAAHMQPALVSASFLDRGKEFWKVGAEKDDGQNDNGSLGANKAQSQGQGLLPGR